MSFRVWVVFMPGVPTFKGVGSWRVICCLKAKPASPYACDGILISCGELSFTSNSPVKPGQWCNPAKLALEYQRTKHD
jgi:hypothetical protein